MHALVIKSALLNTISLITIYAFDLFLVPLLGLNRAQLDLDEFAPAHWLHRNIGVFYTVLFQIPVVGGALYLNVSSIGLLFGEGEGGGMMLRVLTFGVQSTWSTVVARRIYSLQHGRSSGSSSLSGLSASHEKCALPFLSSHSGVILMGAITFTESRRYCRPTPIGPCLFSRACRCRLYWGTSRSLEESSSSSSCAGLMRTSCLLCSSDDHF